MSLPVLFFYGFAFVGIIHSILFSFFAIRSRRTPDFIITIYLLAQSLVILEYVFFWSGLNASFHYFNCISVPLLFLFGPLLYIYVGEVLHEGRSVRMSLLHFVPAAIVLLLMLPFFFSTGNLKNFHYKMIPYFVLDLQVMPYITMAHMGIYLVATVVRIFVQKRVGHIDAWLITLVSLYGIYVACYISYYVMAAQPWFTLTHDYFVSLGMCASIVAIIYVAYGRTRILNGYPVSEAVNPKNILLNFRKHESAARETQKKNIELSYHVPAGAAELENETHAEDPFETPPPDKPFEKYKSSGLTSDLLNELAQNLSALMKTEHLYRESELKLETLSQKLGVSRHHLSQVINQVYGVNFFEYINMLRVEEAKQLLVATDKELLNVIEIAYAVGYNTKNTFNNAFRRITGITPTAYREQHKVRLN